MKLFNYYTTQIPLKVYLAIALGIPLVALIILFVMILTRQRHQVFSSDIKPINAPPSDLSPAVAGVLMDGRMGPREIAAILIDLACRGYIFITRKDDTFTFGKRKSLSLESMPSLAPFEQVLLTKIFEPTNFKSTKEDVEIRVGRHIFSRKIAKVYLEIYNEATRRGYFVKNPVTVHLRWKYSGIALYFLGFLGFMHNAVYLPDPKFTLFLWIGEMLAATWIIQLSGLMPARSQTGKEALGQWLAFKNYLKSSEPIEAGTSFKDIYMRYLPYAIVFGVEVEWSKRFINERFTKPDWYDSLEPTMTIDSFMPGLFPLIGFIGEILAKSHEPTVE